MKSTNMWCPLDPAPAHGEETLQADVTAGDFAPLGEATATLGESPVWSAEEDCVWWVDVTGRRLFRTAAADGATEHWPMPEEIGFVVPLSRGGVAVGLESGLFAFDPSSGALEQLLPLEDEGVRFNDATTDAAGRLWASTMDLRNERAVGRILRIDPDFRVTVIESGMRTPNGLAVDEQRGLIYWSDTHREIRTIWTAPLDPATGLPGERRVLAVDDGARGRPDGGAVDADGNYWSAGVDGGFIRVWRPDGGPAFDLATPMHDPTKIAFGGPDLSRIYLTSKDGDGGGGRLMAADSGFRGRPLAPFGPPSGNPRSRD